MQNFKDTLIMPKTDFEMKGNLNKKEPEIQENWIKDEIYQKLLKKNKNKKNFTLHDGPPYANGNIHVGHALNKILKDIIVRYKNMNGFYAHYVPGWDTHGLPIENAITKIDKNFEVISSASEKRKKCKSYALEQVENQTKQFKRLGLVTDFKDKYLTLDHSFVMDELKLFKIMVEKGLVFQDFKPIYWSWSTKCALAEAEIEYGDVVSPSIYVSFNLKDEDASLIIWTTTPWTIPSNLAIAVNPEFVYDYIEVNNKKYVVAHDLLETIAKDLEWSNYKIVKQIKGTELENKKYKHPFIDREGIVILADYVSNANGTGLVHNAPGFGQEDYYACKKYSIDVYCPIDDEGKFDKSINDKELEGVFYIKANEIILERLLNTGSLLKKSEIKHSVAHDWRTHKPIMFRATKQWFINISKVKDEIINSLDKDVSYLNTKTIQRIKEMIENRAEWCISRQRVWGVPITIIYNENMEPIFDSKLLDHILSIIDKEGVDIWFEKDADYFIPDWMDKNKKYYKEKDIIDVWFDSGSSFNILEHHGLNYPADLYLEGSDQFRGWFNSSAINGTIQKSKVPYKFLLQHGFILDENGFKMSKSKGNTLDPLELCEEFGADILRLWVASTEYNIDTRIGKNILKQIVESYKKIRNTLFRYSLSNLNGFDSEKDFINELRIEDKYIITRLKTILNEVTKYYDNYDFLNITKTIVNFTNELSQWYFDIIKDELYCEKADSLVRKQIQTTLYIVLRTLMITLTPIIPHTCEELYKHFDLKDKKESVMLEEWVNLENLESLDIEQMKEFDEFFKLKDKVYQELEVARQQQLIKKNNEATITLKNTTKFSAQTLKRWLNVAEIVLVNDDQIKVENKQLCKCERCWNYYNSQNMASDNLCSRCDNVINFNSSK